MSGERASMPVRGRPRRHDGSDMTEQDAGYETIRVERRGRVGWITLDRPEALNALNTQTMRDVVAAAETFDADTGIGAIVVTGSEKAFAAGADIK